MSPPDAASLEKFSLAELWNAVRALISEVMRLRADNAALQGRAEAPEAAFAVLKVETQALRDEGARLKGLPPRPPSRPSGMERSTGDGAGAGKARRKPQRWRGPKRDRDAVTSALVVKASPPPGSRFKAYEGLLVRALRLSAEVVPRRRERWVTPSGETVLAALPSGIVGGFGPGLRRFLLAAHAQGQVAAERLVALLASRLDELIAEDREVLRAGLATARWVTVDDTAARHARADGVTTQIGDDRFTAFRTGGSKSREAFLSHLRAGHGEYVISEAALDYMRSRALPGPVIGMLAAHPVKLFADDGAWQAHLASLGLGRLAVTPDPVRVATEGALWGTITARGLLGGTVIVSDDAGQFRLGEHALCWVHAERLVHKLVPTTAEQRRAIELTRTLIWWFYADLKAWKREPCPRRAAALRARFDRIFTRRTRYVVLDRLLARLHRRKAELLRVLERPEIPLHTNATENDLRACVTKRKISGGTMSEAGRTARDVLLGLMKTCRKLGVSFFRYLGDRLRVPGATPIPPLPDLVRQAASPA